MFRVSGGGGGGATLHGAFIQVPEGCLIRAWESGSLEMAVLTTFAVDSIDETLGMVQAMGGRVHSYVCSLWRMVMVFPSNLHRAMLQVKKHYNICRQF